MTPTASCRFLGFTATTTLKHGRKQLVHPNWACATYIYSIDSFTKKKKPDVTPGNYS